MPFLRQVVHAEKSQVQVRSLMEVRNTGVQGLARSFEGHKLGKASLGIPEKVGEQTRPPARWPSAGAGRANAAMRAWQTPRTDVWDSTEKSRRCSQGSDILVAEGLRRNLSVLGSHQLPFLTAHETVPRAAPPTFDPGGGAVVGSTGPGGRRGSAPRARRLRARPEAVSPVPGLPESARLCPGASASLPGPEPGLSGRPPSAAGWLSPRGKGADSHLGRYTLAREPRSPDPLQMKASIGFPALL